MSRSAAFASTVSPMLTQRQLQTILAAHLVFLKNGGAGGSWKTILLKGMPYGVYFGPEPKKGKQACLERYFIPTCLSFENAILAFSNCCAIEAEEINAQSIELSYSLCTDGNFRGGNFRKAKLAKTDFSRADLSACNFREADCSGVDFEYCKLENADFRGARLNGANFKSAILKNVLW